MLLQGTPHAFAMYEQYVRFVEHLTAGSGIHPHNFLFRGSTKIGFSISPNRKTNKLWRQFGPTSDLDLAIVDPHFYATLDEQVRRHDRSNLQDILLSRKKQSVKEYRNRVEQKGRHDCYRYFDLPRGLACMDEMAKVLNTAPIDECCVHPFPKLEAFIYRDRWAVFRRYHTDLHELRRGLRDKNLPQAGAEPLPHQPE